MRTDIQQESWVSSGARINAEGLPINSKITGYTRHGATQALGRDNAIVDAVNNPVSPPIQQSGGTIKFVGKNATVVLNQSGAVVTTWANNSAGIR